MTFCHFCIVNFIYLFFAFIVYALKLLSSTTLKILIVWQLFHPLCSREAERKRNRSPKDRLKKKKEKKRELSMVLSEGLLGCRHCHVFLLNISSSSAER